MCAKKNIAGVSPAEKELEQVVKRRGFGRGDRSAGRN